MALAKIDVIRNWADKRPGIANNNLWTDGVNLFSYALMIGTRNLDGETIALAHFSGMSVTTSGHATYAISVAQNVFEGLKPSRITSYRETRVFLTDESKIGDYVTRQYSPKVYKRTSTAIKALNYAKDLAAERLKAGIDMPKQEDLIRSLGLVQTIDGWMIEYNHQYTRKDIAVPSAYTGGYAPDWLPAPV